MNTNYMIFVLGYDLLHNELNNADLPCDTAMEVCKDIYDEFVDSIEYLQEKSEYSCLKDWLENHKGTVDRLIEQNCR